MESFRSSPSSPAISPSPPCSPHQMTPSAQGDDDGCVSLGEPLSHAIDGTGDESSSQATDSDLDETPPSDLYKRNSLADELQEMSGCLLNLPLILQWSVFCAITSVVIAVTLRYIAQPPVVYLPVHVPVVELPSSLRALTTPWEELPRTYSWSFGKLCSCPLRWMRERDRYNPDADGLYDFELWEDAPSDLPGRMYPLDETEMDELGATCRELMGKAISVGETVSDIPDHIAQAHKDTLEVISEIAYRLRVLYANNNTDQDSIMGSYLSEFEASHIAYWDEQVPVEDPNLTKSRHKRKNPRSLIMRNVSRWEERTHLHSLGALGAKLSGLIDSIADLRSQAQVLESRMIELAKDPQNDKACLLPFTQDLLDMDKVLNDISILAEHQTSVVREMLDSIDALRVSLRGFHRGRIERGLFGNRFGHLCLLRNDTALQGDHWQATWAWMGFDMDAWTRRTPSSSAIKVVRYIKKCLPRHPVRLPDVMVQYEALRDAFRIAEQETKRLGTWVPNVPAKLREIRDGLGSFA